MNGINLSHLPEITPSSVTHAQPYSVRCSCGRFAKWIGGRYYYNSNYDCYRFTVHCIKHGVIDIEWSG